MRQLSKRLPLSLEKTKDLLIFRFKPVYVDKTPDLQQVEYSFWYYSCPLSSVLKYPVK
jgi:hypothetical protein